VECRQLQHMQAHKRKGYTDPRMLETYRPYKVYMTVVKRHESRLMRQLFEEEDEISLR
jgi:hypothetical protein